MLLAVDVGNTNMVFALVEQGQVRARWRIATEARRTADEYAVWLKQLLELEGLGFEAIGAVIVGTVVPRAIHNLSLLASQYCKAEMVVAGQGRASWPLALDVDEPQSVGADRALNAIAAHAAHEGDLVIVDFGTATTFDVVDYSGAYKGGIIAPGINLSLDALTGKTAQLPRIAIEEPGDDSVIGTTTASQMQIGVYWGYVAMIEGLLARLKAEIGRPAKVIATGGLAALFDEIDGLFDEVDFELTLRGLVLMHEQAVRA
ncbi:type III pantothenate kinase [Sphingomicrobium astaxanthinifaciens]|uniref:type III pantothenate kinase n=1 Tax=Sphingomicrobium astaxanthinifaciens TaxID=1227949 RepID=UPI001FCAA5F9|nr:type III pantothenate kinase [Sphingomicrobium astaxanthinifaciens]MCJ7422164.1 type III pantothenate kinase [Sphingomicrobium astaxanthinifaciens]